MITGSQFLQNWLRGTTCGHEARMEIFWTSECGQYIIAKHNGHSTYCGRALGVLYCEVVYELHDLHSIDDPRNLHFFSKGLKSWKGRWSKAKQAEAEGIINEHT